MIKGWLFLLLASFKNFFPPMCRQERILRKLYRLFHLSWTVLPQLGLVSPAALAESSPLRSLIRDFRFHFPADR
jgi:hypothetical protein